jgi:hypothetical protein
MISFPFELWEEVASYLSPRSLKQFSLTSKACASLARPILFEAVDVILWEREWLRFQDFIINGTKLHHYVRRLEIHLQDIELERSYHVDLWIACIKRNFDRQAQTHNWSEQKRASKHHLVDTVGKQMYATCQEEDDEREPLLLSVLQFEIWQPILHQLHNLRAIWLSTDGLGNESREGRRFVEQSHGSTSHSGVHPRGRGGHWVSRDIQNCSRFLYSTLIHFVQAFGQLEESKLRELDFGNIAWQYGLHFQPGCPMLVEWRRLLAPVEKLSLLFTRASFSPLILPEVMDLALSQNVTWQIVAQTGDQLKELKIGWDRDTFGLPIACNPIVQMGFPQLQLFSVGGFSFTLEPFQQFLARHAGTLKRLELHDVTLVPTDDACSAAQALGNFFCWLTESLNLHDARFSGTFRVNDDHVLGLYSMDRERPWLILHRREIGAIRHRRSPIGLQIGLVVSSRRPVTHLTPQYRGWNHTSREDRVRWIRTLMYLDFKAPPAGGVLFAETYDTSHEE